MQDAQDRTGFVRRCFAFADRDRDGFLRGHDLKCGVAAALGIRPSKARVTLMIAQLFDGDDGVVNSDGGPIRVSEQQFVTIMLARMRRTDVLEDVRRLFKALDVRAQGFLSLQSFQSVCSSALPHLPPRTVLSAFHEADRDGDGRVTYPDFERMYLLAVEAQRRRDISESQRSQ